MWAIEKEKEKKKVYIHTYIKYRDSDARSGRLTRIKRVGINDRISPGSDDGTSLSTPESPARNPSRDTSGYTKSIDHFDGGAIKKEKEGNNVRTCEMS